MGCLGRYNQETGFLRYRSIGFLRSTKRLDAWRSGASVFFCMWQRIFRDENRSQVYVVAQRSRKI